MGKKKSQRSASTDHVSASKQKKMDQSEELSRQILAANSVSVVELKGTPGAHVSSLRKLFGKDAQIIVRKKPVIMKALEKAAKSKSSMSGLLKFVEGAQPALILSSVSPFKINGMTLKAKTPARAKIGRISDREVKVPAGDTGLPPGPAIGDLQKINLPAKIQKGKIVVEKDTVVVKPGDAISKDVAAALLKLGIEPFETQLNILAAWQDDLVYGKDVLSIDETFVYNNIMKAQSQAVSLAMETEFPTADTAELLVQKAALVAANFAIEAKLVAGTNVSEALGGASQ
jgi:large subunit ribosomal protein L10